MMDVFRIVYNLHQNEIPPCCAVCRSPPFFSCYKLSVYHLETKIGALPPSEREWYALEPTSNLPPILRSASHAYSIPNQLKIDHRIFIYPPLSTRVREPNPLRRTSHRTKHEYNVINFLFYFFFTYCSVVPLVPIQFRNVQTNRRNRRNQFENKGENTFTGKTTTNAKVKRMRIESKQLSKFSYSSGGASTRKGKMKSAVKFQLPKCESKFTRIVGESCTESSLFARELKNSLEREFLSEKSLSQLAFRSSVAHMERTQPPPKQHVLRYRWLCAQCLDALHLLDLDGGQVCACTRKAPEKCP